MESLLERDVLIRLTEKGFAVTTRSTGLPESWVEYETSAAGEPVGELEVVRSVKNTK
jgi:hypothetical protein